MKEDLERFPYGVRRRGALLGSRSRIRDPVAQNLENNNNGY